MSSDPAAIPLSESECLRGEAAGPMDWLADLLKEAMSGVMASDATPLQKANAVARLGNLYLKAHRAGELQRANKQLAARVAELEERLSAVEGSASPHEALTADCLARPVVLDSAALTPSATGTPASWRAAPPAAFAEDQEGAVMLAAAAAVPP